MLCICQVINLATDTTHDICVRYRGAGVTPNRSFQTVCQRWHRVCTADILKIPQESSGKLGFFYYYYYPVASRIKIEIES